jgi:hypothetical protein
VKLNIKGRTFWKLSGNVSVVSIGTFTILTVEKLALYRFLWKKIAFFGKWAGYFEGIKRKWSAFLLPISMIAATRLFAFYLLAELFLTNWYKMILL